MHLAGEAIPVVVIPGAGCTVIALSMTCKGLGAKAFVNN